MTAYFISGLGADERIFENIVLPQGITRKHVQWIEPQPAESLYNYCLRLSAQIDTGSPFILIGLSFGGMVAVEMTRFLQPRHTIIISTIAVEQEMPVTFRVVQNTRIYKCVSPRLLKIPNALTYWFFGAVTAKEKALIRSFLANVSPNYLRWSIHVIMNWHNAFRPTNLTHIHGTADRIFPIGRTHAQYRVQGGAHFMVHDKAEAISAILREVLLKLAD